MVCPQCGNYLEERNNFCEHCQQFVRPITEDAYHAQIDSKELKELPKDNNQSSGSAFDNLLISIKDPKNRLLVIISLIALTGCVVMTVLFSKLYFQKSANTQPVVPVSSSDETIVVHKLNLQSIGADDYGYTSVPDTWINAVYDSSLGDDLPSIQYVSVDGKYSVTLSKTSSSTATLNSCATNLQNMMIDYFNVADNDEKKVVRIDKVTVNQIPAFCVHGTYEVNGKPTCTISSYLLMDDNDNLYMITLASYDKSTDLSFALDNFSFKKPEEKEKTESENELNLW